MIVRALASLALVAVLAGCELLTTPVSRTSATPSASGPSPSPVATATATPVPTSTATPTVAPTPTAAPTGYVSPRGTITVDQPRAFARVTSPFTATGTAMLFEGAFTWRLVDLAGTELAKGSGTASPGAPSRGTFSFSVTYTLSADTFGYLEVTSLSAKDGSIDDQARVPLVLGAR